MSEGYTARAPSANIQRKLTAILCADVQGFSRLMGEDEEATLRTLTAYREVTDALIHQHRGRIVGTAGDSVLAEFASVVDAVRCAVEIQQQLKAENADLPAPQRMEFRIGINLGDVMVEGEQIYGDGVNVAARLQGLADAGGIFISGTVYDQVETKLALNYEYLDEQTVKNITRPVRVYRVQLEVPSPPVEQASSLHAARMAAPLEGQGEGAARRGGAAQPSHPDPPPLMPHTSSLITQSALPLPDKPSIAVLPFVNMSSDPEQEYFSDGITEDLITDLSRLSGLFVIARNSTFTYKGKAVKVEEVGRELGVQYVLEGSIRKAGARVRITAQLVDAITSHHLWAERYDRELTDIFALQDEITHRIVGALAVQLTKGEREHLERPPSNNLEAYDYFLRGQEHYYRSTKEANAQARTMWETAIELDANFAGAYAWLGLSYCLDWAAQMWETAIELDANFAGAYAWLGLSYCLDWAAQWNPHRETLQQGLAAVQKAIALDDALSVAHNALGRLYVFIKQYDPAVVEGERAIALNPNDAEAYANLASTLNFVGRAQEAAELVEKAMRLNPRYPAFYLYVLGQAFRLLGRTEEAITIQKRALARSPDFLVSHVALAVMYSESGREQEARTEAVEILRIYPHFSLERWQQGLPFKDQVEVDRVVTALRKAGLK